MEWLNVLLARLRGLLRREAVIDDIEEELRIHVEMETQANVERGMSFDEARREALASFGNVGRMRELAYEVRGGGLMDRIWQDLRYGLRRLLKTPSFTAVAVLTLAVGIGATTAIFSVIYATFLAPLPYPEPEQLVMVWSKKKGERTSTSYRDYLDWKERSTSFSSLNAWTGWRFTLVTPNSVDQVDGDRMTPGFLEMCGEQPMLGRYFLPEEGIPGNDKVVVITNRFWRERFGGDPSVVGSQLRINGESYTLIGVRPPGLPDRVESTMSAPLAFTDDDIRNQRDWVMVMGRLRPDASIAQADAELDTITETIADRHKADERWTSSVEPLQNNFLADTTKLRLWLMMGAVAFVLLIACANVANLMLARGTARRRELAVRASIGATPGRLFGQLLTESVTLALLGGALGVALSWVGLRAILAIMPPYTLPGEAEVGLNLSVLFFTLGAAVLAGVLFGCAPAFQATRVDLNETLKEGGRTDSASGRSWLRRALVVSEFALALTLVAGAALVIHSLWNLTRVDFGIRPERLLTFFLPVQNKRFSHPDQVTAFYDRLLEQIEATPGVERAAVSTGLAVVESGFDLEVTMPGQVESAAGSAPTTAYKSVAPSYVDTLGINVVQGRKLAATDVAGGTRVALVSETFVRRFFDGVDPVGQRFLLPAVELGATGPGAPVEWQVVGVFRDVVHGGPRSGSEDPEVLVPFAQSPWSRVWVTVQTHGEPGDVRSAIAGIVRSMDPETPVANVKTMEQWIAAYRAPDLFGAALFASFAGVALLLAALGIYGVMAYNVTQRTHEIGIRVAMGAQTRDVLKLVLGQGMSLALVGVMIGLLASAALTRLMESLLFGVSAADPLTFVAIPLLLIGVALLACWIPARRAARVDPIVALHQG
jgi:predicted permease